MIYRFLNSCKARVLLLSALMSGCVFSNAEEAAVNHCLSGLSQWDKRLYEETQRRILERVTPEFPTSNRAFLLARSKNSSNKGQVACVVLKFDIDSSGYAKNTLVKASNPEGVFDRVSLRAINKFRFSIDESFQNEGVHIFNFRVTNKQGN